MGWYHINDLSLIEIAALLPVREHLVADMRSDLRFRFDADRRQRAPPPPQHHDKHREASDRLNTDHPQRRLPRVSVDAQLARHEEDAEARELGEEESQEMIWAGWQCRRCQDDYPG